MFPYVFCSLLEVFPDHLNAEIVAGTVTSKQDAMDYLTWTYFFRRLLMNPSYYQLEGEGSAAINQYLSELVNKALGELQASYCIDIEEVTSRGRVANRVVIAMMLCVLAFVGWSTSGQVL